MVLKYIEHLKTKPERVRKQFAFLASFAVTFVVFAGWMASYAITSAPAVAKDDSKKVDAPVSSLTASVVGIYEDVKTMLFGSNEASYSSSDAIEIGPGNR